MPPQNHFVNHMKALDVKVSDKVICYDTGARNVFGYRAAWMLEAMGHPNAWVLDGGLKKWVDENRPVDERSDADFSYSLSETKYVDYDGFKSADRERKAQIVDTRSENEFSTTPIKDAVNINFAKVFTDDEFKELRSIEER